MGIRFRNNSDFSNTQLSILSAEIPCKTALCVMGSMLLMLTFFVLTSKLFLSEAFARVVYVKYEEKAGEVRYLIMSERFSDAAYQLEDALNAQKLSRDGSHFTTAIVEELFDPNPYVNEQEEIAVHLTSWVKQETTSAWARLLRGVYYLRLADNIPKERRDSSEVLMEKYKKSLLQAKKDIVAGTKLARHNVVAQYFRLKLSRFLGEKNSKKKKYFKRVIKLFPGHFQAYRERLTQYDPRWGGSTKKSLTFAKKVTLKAKPGSPLSALLPMAYQEAARRRADTKEFLSREAIWSEIEKYFLALMESHPKAAFFPILFAEIAEDAGNFVIAERNYNRALDNDLDNPEALFALGKFQASKDDYRAALGRYSMAIKLYPTHQLRPYHYTYRALAYLKLADLESTLSDCDRALELDPKNISAQQLKKLVLDMKQKKKVASVKK